MPAWPEARHGLGAPVGERVGHPHRLAGQAAHRQAHLFQRLAGQRRDALGLAGVHDRQQLGAQVVVQVGGDALALLLGHLLDAQLRQLREVALDLERRLLDPALQRRFARPRRRAARGRTPGPGESSPPAPASAARSAARARARSPRCGSRSTHLQQQQQGEQHEDRAHDPELRALTAPGDPQVGRHRDQQPRARAPSTRRSSRRTGLPGLPTPARPAAARTGRAATGRACAASGAHSAAGTRPPGRPPARDPELTRNSAVPLETGSSFSHTRAVSTAQPMASRPKYSR